MSGRFRLVGAIGGQPVRLDLPAGTHVLGSGPDCALRLDHPTVSRIHAELNVDEERVRVRDLDSRNGTFLGSRRITAEHLGPGASLAFGQVVLALERVSSADATPAVSFEPSTRGAARTSPRDGTRTVRTKPLETFAVEQLPALLELVAQGADRTRLAQALGAALFETLPVLAVEIADEAGSERGLLFAAARELSATEPVELLEGRGGLAVCARFPDLSSADAFRPIVRAAAALVQLAGRSQAPPEPAPRLSVPPPPDPPSVVPEVRQLYADAARVAAGDVGVLICGESGTGKEVLARFLHAASPRRTRAFVALNCAALPRDLLEAELFGIEKGVATGVEARPGKFELAHGGTLFLDEVGDMALETQAKILRVLQEAEVYRLGGAAPRKAEVRVVAATNKDMQALLAQKLFREDLYYRIATWVVELPPLRRRKQDIPSLAAHFLAREARKRGLELRGVSQAALDRLVAHGWPGNVRQLEKEMARAVLFLSDGELLDSRRLSPEIGAEAPAADATLSAVLESVEREQIVQALRKAQGDVALAAAALGLGRSTLYRRMSQLGLPAEPE